MAWEQIAQGTGLNIGSLGQYEDEMPEGSRGMLELNTVLPVPDDILGWLEDRLIDAGIPDLRVTADGSNVRILFRKGFPWLGVIATIVIGLILLAVLITGWKLYKEIGPAVPAGIGIALGIGALVLLAYVGTREVLEEKAKKVIYG